MATPTETPGHVIYVRKIPEIKLPGMRLGRHVRRDSRSLRYAYRPRRAPSTLSDKLWPRHIPILDQGDVGSCTGNEETGVLGTDPFFETLAIVTRRQAAVSPAVAALLRVAERRLASAAPSG